ncbi:homeobox-leucine zipper protein ROC3-like [Olea europaea var. sylvestris]|uniref:homeobox-leucine zipper protein ROC3-like n=1 Tax=Olea europaea var. sylvestris TaxID=158386 RepID=UPI000C1CF53D|nr:homeobox-leucine zipper protein ROC3-like [Olea europaea var. sylvestris]
MYGDCQVLSSVGGNAIPSDTLYSSSIQNPNFNFMANINPFNIFSPINVAKEENVLAKSKEEMESGSGSEHMEGVSGNEQETEVQPQPKKKRYHRHTARQIQEMEALFKECPHPDDKQRMKLSQDLGLKPRQVKFWFQNRRTQMKAQQDRQDNVLLRAENENLCFVYFQNKWMELFPSIISRAKTLQVVHSGVSGHSTGSLHLMYAELQVLSPLVPTREAHFLRYCQHNAEEGAWAIVDFPLDNFQTSYPPSFPYYRRRPSGCIIQDMPNGYSRVTWVEHAEVEDSSIHPIFNHFVSNGMAFGAQRWLAVLQRQCQRFASFMARNISDLGVIPSPEARKNLMNLAQRMIRTFCLNISTCCGQSWTALSDSAEDTVRITTRKVTEPGQPNGLILGAVSTIWLPFPHNKVFDFLRDEQRRIQLDVLSNGNSLHEVAHIANGSHPGNSVSLLRINVASNSSQNVELMLQESCTDDSGSIVVYTTIDVDSIQLAMNGEDPSCIPLLPLGFIISPMGHAINDSSITSEDTENGNLQPDSGCLLTVGLQVLASTIPTAKLNLSSVTAINHHMCNTIQQISSALSSGNGNGNCPNNNGNFFSTSVEPQNAEPVSPTKQNRVSMS